MAGSRSRILWALPTASTPTRTWATIRSITPTRLGNQALAGVFQTVLSVFSSYYGPSRYGFTGLGASVSQGIANRLGTQGSLSAGRQTLGGGSGYTPTGFASSQQGQTYDEIVAQNRQRLGRFGLSSFSFRVLAFDGSTQQSNNLSGRIIGLEYMARDPGPAGVLARTELAKLRNGGTLPMGLQGEVLMKEYVKGFLNVTSIILGNAVAGITNKALGAVGRTNTGKAIICAIALCQERPPAQVLRHQRYLDEAYNSLRNEKSITPIGGP